MANITIKGKKVISKGNKTTKAAEPAEKEPLTSHSGDDIAAG